MAGTTSTTRRVEHGALEHSNEFAKGVVGLAILAGVWFLGGSLVDAFKESRALGADRAEAAERNKFVDAGQAKTPYDGIPILARSLNVSEQRWPLSRLAKLLDEGKHPQSAYYLLSAGEQAQFLVGDGAIDALNSPDHPRGSALGVLVAHLFAASANSAVRLEHGLIRQLRAFANANWDRPRAVSMTVLSLVARFDPESAGRYQAQHRIAVQQGG